MQRTQYDAVIVGAGPKRTGSCRHSGAAGPVRCHIRSGRHDRWWHPHRRTYSPGFQARRVFWLSIPWGWLRHSSERLPLDRHGLRWIQPNAPLAHPLDDGTAVLLSRDMQTTVDGLGSDGAAYQRLLSPICRELAGAFRRDSRSAAPHPGIRS